MYRVFILTALAISLAGCEDDTTALSYIAINHTPKYIESIAINDEGGILDASAMGGGGKEVCCVVIPRHWHNGLKVKIAWKQGSHAKLDKHGREIVEDGVPVVIEGTWKSRVVSIPKYDSVHLGRMHIHFMPNDQVIVKIGNFAYRAPGYYPPYPESNDTGGEK